MPISDDDLLHIVADERRRSIGFDHDHELRRERELALEYRKGVMKDVPALPNRSKAVSMDVADAIEMLMAKLVPIFTEGDDVAEFEPRGPQDEDQARLETDYVSWVVFQQNSGFLMLESFFRDALESKVGVVKVWWEDPPESTPEVKKGVPGAQAVAAMLQGGVQGVAEADDSGDTQDEPLFDLTLEPPTLYGRVRIKAWPPEDFAVAADVVELKDATYCAARSRPRAQDLKAEGVDPAKVDDLPGYDWPRDEIDQARDTAGEHLESTQSSSLKDLRQVEIVEHFIRVVDERESQLWRVVTGENETVLLDREQVDRVPFAAITPFQVSHRFYGESVADKTIELQRIKTALTRLGLDSAYFALNQRMYVDTTKANEFTIPDLLDNRPGMPIRGDGEGAVTPIASSGLTFPEVAQGLEYFSTVLEERTGIVRNAQGLNPDTLHDTASGAAMLNAAANERARYIARRFGETGVKDIYLITHQLLRKHASQAQPVKLKGEWQTPSPMQWAQRHDVSIEVGVGSGDRAQTLAMLGQVIMATEKVVQAQGGTLNGPIVTAQNVYAQLSDLVSKSGSKKASVYFSDPSKQPPQPPASDPNAAQAQADAQMKQAQIESQERQAAAKLQGDQATASQRAQIDASRLRLDAQTHADTMALEHRKLDLKQQEMAAGLHTRREDAAGKLAVDRDKIHSDAAVKTHGIDTQAHTALTVAAMREATAKEVQASKEHDAEVLDD